MIGAGWRWAERVRHGGGTLRVLALHDTPDATVLRERLRLLAENFDIVAPDAVTASPATASTRPRLLLSFDDGYANWHSVALPVLADLGLGAVFFVSSGLVGLKGAALRDFLRRRLLRRQELPALEPEQLRELAAQPGLAIGGHGTSHAHLGLPRDAAFWRAEIDDDRRRLEEWTGRQPMLFAYPFGRPETVSPAAKAAVAAAGYRAAFTIVPGAVHAAADPFALPRHCLDLTVPWPTMRAKLSGWHDPLHAIRALILGRRDRRRFALAAAVQENPS